MQKIPLIDVYAYPAALFDVELVEEALSSNEDSDMSQSESEQNERKPPVFTNPEDEQIPRHI